MSHCIEWVHHPSLSWIVVNILWLWAETQKRTENQKLTSKYMVCYTYNFRIKSHKIQPHCRTFVFWRIISIFSPLSQRYGRFMLVCVRVYKFLWPGEVDVIAICAAHALNRIGLLLLHSNSLLLYTSYIDGFNSIQTHTQFRCFKQWTDEKTKKTTMEKDREIIFSKTCSLWIQPTSLKAFSSWCNRKMKNSPRKRKEKKISAKWICTLTNTKNFFLANSPYMLFQTLPNAVPVCFFTWN